MGILKEVITTLFSLALFINAILFIPQALKIHREKIAAEISLSTFIGFLFIQLTAVLYGVITDDYVLIIGYLLSMFSCGAVVALTIRYKNKKRDMETGEIDIRVNTLEDIIAIMPGNVYWIDKNNVYLGCNDNQAKSSGLASRSEIIGKRNADLPWNFDANSLPDDLDKINSEVMVTGHAIIVEEPATLADGTQVIYLSNKVPLRNKQNEIVGMVGISVDITDRKKVEKELQDAITLAETANNAKSEFLRNMEHQLRTPFSGIYSLVQILAEEETNHEKKELLEITYNSAKEFLDLLNDIIDFSRFQAESTAVLAKKFDLRRLIENAMTMQQAAAITKGLELIYDYHDDLPTVFISDPNRLRRIVLNLLSNAIRFTDKGHVSICVKLAKNIDEKQVIVQLIVTDTGIGISEEKQSFIYEKFYRAHPANQNTYLGAGLGLYIVKQLMEDLEGEIDLISALNKGTSFICTLPLKRPLVDEIVENK